MSMSIDLYQITPTVLMENISMGNRKHFEKIWPTVFDVYDFYT